MSARLFGTALCILADSLLFTPNGRCHNWIELLQGKTLRIRMNHSAAGLFAYVVFALNQLYVASLLGLSAHVSFGQLAADGVNAYYDATHGNNTWDYYFLPVSGASGANTRLEDTVEFDVGALWYLHQDWPQAIRSYPYGVDRDRRCGYDAEW